MGDVVPFKRSEPIKLVDPAFNEFKTEYVKNIDAVNNFLQKVVVAASEELDIGMPHGYDIFMMRETLMSMLMRDKGVYHPLQDFTEEFVEIFGK